LFLLPLAGGGLRWGSHLLKYYLQNAICFSKHFVVPEPKNLIAFFLEPCGSFYIYCFLFRMLPTINLNYKLSLYACEVHYESTYRVLPSELISGNLARSEPSPQGLFRFSHVFSKNSCPGDAHGEIRPPILAFPPEGGRDLSVVPSEWGRGRRGKGYVCCPSR